MKSPRGRPAFVITLLNSLSCKESAVTPHNENNKLIDAGA